MITIFACIWVAVHPNIPQPKPPRTSRLALIADAYSSLTEKVTIVLLGLLAPEFILVWALRQWLKARSLAKLCRDAAATETARAGRNFHHTTERDSVVACQRAAFQRLEALGYQRTVRQDLAHRKLRTRMEATEKEHAEPSNALNDDDQTGASELKFYTHRRELFTFSCQTGQHSTDSS